MIETKPFYQTTNDAQSKFQWGSHALQTGDKFNAQAWNDVPTAPTTAWGIQNFGQPMSLQSAMNTIQGQPSTSNLTPGEQAYLAMLDPVAAQQFLASKGLS
jgi:hypothetical protein